MNKTELANRINEIWEIEVNKNGLKTELSIKLQDLKYDVVKNLDLISLPTKKEQEESINYTCCCKSNGIANITDIG